ncbi:MAG: hypothetical protein K9M55_02910 [Candidatus Marinimicrobia bacterium]|nr:hypothetical protein [Candidatus Neomarinimicrobiota bacterium]MCF7921629.1 hypothetical protein [Candidatus Neomarinimicrobiota bacterium]
MINSKHSTFFKYHPLISHLRWIGVFVLMSIQLSAASPPKQLSKVINHFMNLDSVSIDINQVIDWRFSDKSDTVRIQMDIKAGRIFHMMLADYGMEIFVTENEMLTLNHVRQQVLLENASPDALLKQLFVGGDLNEARYKGEKKQSDGSRRLDFQFGGDFSDWESLSVVLSRGDHLEKLILVDYDGNKYIISLTYLAEFKEFDIPRINTDYLHYQVADLRNR